MKTPHYPNRILLTVAGGSPAIVTETLYALTQKNDEPYIPTEIHIITTSGGYEKIKETLAGENGKIKQLCDDYGIERPIFTVSNIHLISDSNGNILEDITSESDNEVTADFIITKVREFTANDDTSLHVSIAGGRKTMTYYIGYAMSVFGRIQDNMSHVLVEDKYISSDFFYPTPQSQICQSREGEFDARDVTVMLGYLPYIRLRDGLTDDLLNDKNKSYSDIIEIAQRLLQPPKIELDNTKLYCGEKLVKLSHSLLSLYLMILKRHKLKKETFIPNSRADEEKNATEYLEMYKNISNESGHYCNLVGGAEKRREVYPYTETINMEYFGSQRTKINEKIQESLGKSLAERYLIKSPHTEGSTVKHNTTYYLSDEIKPEHIHIKF